MQSISTTETFIPFNQNKAYILVDFIRIYEEDDYQIMLVEYKGDEYKLTWDHYNGYYTGLIDNEKGFIP